MLLKVIFIVAGIAGLVATFYANWFWRGLIIPMVVILFVDVILEFIKKK